MRPLRSAEIMVCVEFVENLEGDGVTVVSYLWSSIVGVGDRTVVVTRFFLPGGHTVACLRFILERVVCPRPMAGRRWSAFDSYEVTHVYRARWTVGGLPLAHSGRAVCSTPLNGKRVVGL